MVAAHRQHGSHAGQGLQGGDLIAVDAHLHSVQRTVELREDAAAARHDRRQYGGLLRVDCGGDAAMLRVRDPVIRRICLRHRDGIRRHLHDDGDLLLLLRAHRNGCRPERRAAIDAWEVHERQALHGLCRRPRCAGRGGSASERKPSQRSRKGNPGVRA